MQAQNLYSFFRLFLSLFKGKGIFLLNELCLPIVNSVIDKGPCIGIGFLCSVCKHEAGSIFTLYFVVRCPVLKWKVRRFKCAQGLADLSEFYLESRWFAWSQ